MVKLTCPKCKHTWEYTGDSKYYVTCPRCYTKINRQKLENEKSKDN